MRNKITLSNNTISEQVHKLQEEVIRLHFEYEERALQAALGLMFPDEIVIDEGKITKNVIRRMGGKGDIVVWKYKDKILFERCEKKIKELFFREFLLANPHILRLLMTLNDRKINPQYKNKDLLKNFQPFFAFKTERCFKVV